MNSCNNFRDQRELNRDYREEGPYKRQRFNSHSVSPRPSKNYGEKQAKFLDNRPNHRKRNESPLNEAQEWSKPDYRNSRNPKNDGLGPKNIKNDNWALKTGLGNKKDWGHTNSRWQPKTTEWLNKSESSVSYNFPEKNKECLIYSKNIRREEPKKIRNDFPEELLYEYGFLASRSRNSTSESVFKLINPNSGKDEIDDLITTIASNK